MPDYNFYEIPTIFASDWLNEFLVDNGRDDYKFTYMGPKNTWTGFHSDVFGSYSWSTNICGQKKWVLLPPGEEQKLKDSLGNLPFSISEEILDNSSVKYFKLIQNAGEALFVPSGFFHQVWNLQDTISINHNWLNGCNISTIYRNMKRNLDEVLIEIQDCQDMDDFPSHCQLMLKSMFGMNFQDFLELLCHIANKRLKRMSGVDLESTDFENFVFGANHVMFDLSHILEVLERMQEENATLLITLNLSLLLENCIENIKSTIT